MIDVRDLQTRLNANGFTLAVDGVLGSQTYAALFAHVAGRSLGLLGPSLGRGAVSHFGNYEITTPLRLAHFLAQAAHETGAFKYLKELGGPTYFKRYDGRRDLGNTRPGDGAKYAGRGIFQLTGRANYTEMGIKLGLDLVNKPELASDPEISVLIACDYWRSRKINPLADADNVEGVTRKINGGVNGLADRIHYLAKAKGVLK